MVVPLLIVPPTLLMGASFPYLQRVNQTSLDDIGKRVGAGFVRGVETTITMDEEQFVGVGYFLFACVLERFLAMYASLNSFNQLSLRTEQREETVREFSPRAGTRELL